MRSPDRTSSFYELHNYTLANVPAAVLDKGLKNQIAGRGEDCKAILGLNRPRGVFRQPSMGHSFLLSSWPGSLPPLQPPKGGPTTESSAGFQGKPEPGHFHQGAN